MQHRKPIRFRHTNINKIKVSLYYVYTHASENDMMCFFLGPLNCFTYIKPIRYCHHGIYSKTIGICIRPCWILTRINLSRRKDGTISLIQTLMHSITVIRYMYLSCIKNQEPSRISDT